MKKILPVCLLVFSTPSLFAQKDSLAVFSFSAYGEIYYGYDFSKPASHEKPRFLYNFKRHNEVNINLMYVKGSYSAVGARANLALMTGNYAQYNLAAEPTLSQVIFEANAGLKLSKRQNLWLDVGIMPSHIGFESAVGADCWTLTRSLVAENSPYYETGIQLGFANARENLSVKLLLLNGWQRIQRPKGSNRLSGGMQLNWKPNSFLTLNYSNFIGTDKPDSLNALRTYHNFYGIWNNGDWGIIAGFDVGTDKKPDGTYGSWLTPIVIARKSLSKELAIACRVEYFADADEIIIPTSTENGFRTWGLSANSDYRFSSNMLCRIEGRWLKSKDEIFELNGQPSRDNFAATASLSVKF
jgi:hypothetical protein